MDYQRTGKLCGIPLPPGLVEASRFPTPLFTPATKAELGQHDENIPFARVIEMVGAVRANQLRDRTLQTYVQAADHALKKGIIIADTKFEFGVDDRGNLVLADEVFTPDSSRYWLAENYREGVVQHSFDKQFVRNWLTSRNRAGTGPARSLRLRCRSILSMRPVPATSTPTNEFRACASTTGLARGMSAGDDAERSDEEERRNMARPPALPPVAKRVETRRVYHGDVFIDPYEWLRDKSSPEVVAHLEAENAYADAMTAHLEPLRQQIFDEIKARTKETDLSVPTRRGDWWYYVRSYEGKQYGVHCRCPVRDRHDWNPPIFDEHTEIPASRCCWTRTSKPRVTTSLRSAPPPSARTATCSHTPSTTSVTSDTPCGSRTYAQASDTPTRLPASARGDLAIDNRTVYYVTVDAAWRPDTVWRHRLNSGLPSEKVYHEADERFWLAVGRTRSDAYVLIVSGSAITSEVRYADAADPHAQFTTVLPRRDGVEYSVEHAVVGGQDRFLILHNDGAINFTLAEAPVDDPTAQRTLIAHRDDVRLDAVDAFASHLVVSYRRAALPRIQLWPVQPDGATGGRKRSGSTLS
ncbi:phosphoribosylaminoimidazole-succinocarboxamide synthase domain protein [Mycobacterium xenopi 4042]|uniref:phosphoribosylaminoimidazolesuccinocarboxamide synthase n=1 Tax=Mycobacterium xenopi 4042 TaxID=1299334 RepID=X7ZV36_MYCXE|nr:phosphoribosylaminoimidazole-succinocarboxamide synthase domain protein [Mycobacterium xenopi 4042]